MHFSFEPQIHVIWLICPVLKLIYSAHPSSTQRLLGGEQQMKHQNKY